jgi:hypothetical protein
MDIGEPREVEQRRAKIKEVETGRHMAIRALCQHRQGRDLLWWAIESANPFTSSMRYDVHERGDPMRTAYAEGFRGHGTMIMAEVMTADPAAYMLMVSENRNIKELENAPGQPS